MLFFFLLFLFSHLVACAPDVKIFVFLFFFLVFVVYSKDACLVCSQITDILREEKGAGGRGSGGTYKTATSFLYVSQDIQSKTGSPE